RLPLDVAAALPEAFLFGPQCGPAELLDEHLDGRQPFIAGKFVALVVRQGEVNRRLQQAARHRSGIGGRLLRVLPEEDPGRPEQYAGNEQTNSGQGAAPIHAAFSPSLGRPGANSCGGNGVETYNGMKTLEPLWVRGRDS